MNETIALKKKILLGDEAVAEAAIHAGISAAYGYPGTPSTEILEYILNNQDLDGHTKASWCANEKTALEEGLGVSFAGKRALVTMKHVGLNVAADPFINSALVSINGGIVIVVADDPGMHSSQNEQDTRRLADFAGVICLEPSTQQEAYDMTWEAFEVSEAFHIPVVIRLVTRLAHSRALVSLGNPRAQNDLSKTHDPLSWILLPVNARKQWEKLVRRQADFTNYAEHCLYTHLNLNDEWRDLGVITTGLAANYYRESVDELPNVPSHLHIGAYPFPVEKIRRLVDHVDRVLILEEGFPFLERRLRGIIEPTVEIQGKISGHLPAVGELDPDKVRVALGLEPFERIDLSDFQLPARPPRLCQGCPHGDAYAAIRQALVEYPHAMVTSDVGCYTLGALPPYSAIETCLCMGASIGLAKGASDAGHWPVLSVIGDSTFLHSGVTPLMDAVSGNADMTMVILDNETVAMTGTQPTILPASGLKGVVLGTGVDPDHLHVIQARPRGVEENADIIQREVEHRGLSVIILVRECLEKVRKRKQQERKQK